MYIRFIFSLVEWNRIGLYLNGDVAGRSRKELLLSCTLISAFPINILDFSHQSFQQKKKFGTSKVLQKTKWDYH